MSNLLERLRRHKEDRGMMASLRCALVASKKHRTWPVINRLGAKVTDEVAALVAGLYATHSEETREGNLGTTCKAIENRRGDRRGDESKLTPTERRFLHLLAAEKGEELYGRVTRMVLMAESQGVPVNYERLETDLRFWNERTKTDWAAAFWTTGAGTTSLAAEEEGEAT